MSEIATPLVCICIPTYNAGKTIRETLASIVGQSYRNLDIRIVDNASADDTLKVVAEFNDPRISVHRNETNLGGEGNFTRCIQLATGKYTAIFHADDVYEFDMVEKQVSFLEANPDIGAVFTQALTIDENSAPLGKIGLPPSNSRDVARFDFPNMLRAMLLHHNFLVCPSAMVRTSIYQGHIRNWGCSTYRSSSDVDTWLRLAQYQPVAVLREYLMRYRISQAQFSEGIRNRTERTDFFLVMDDYLSRSEVRALLKAVDFRHYGWLVRHEQVARAMNLFAVERFVEAHELQRGVLCFDALRAALHNRRGKVTLAAALLLRLLGGGSARSVRLVKKLKMLAWR